MRILFVDMVLKLQFFFTIKRLRAAGFGADGCPDGGISSPLPGAYRVYCGDS